LTALLPIIGKIQPWKTKESSENTAKNLSQTPLPSEISTIAIKFDDFDGYSG
jgi:hypothetical protein